MNIKRVEYSLEGLEFADNMSRRSKIKTDVIQKLWIQDKTGVSYGFYTIIRPFNGH